MHIIQLHEQINKKRVKEGKPPLTDWELIEYVSYLQLANKIKVENGEVELLERGK